MGMLDVDHAQRALTIFKKLTVTTESAESKSFTEKTVAIDPYWSAFAPPTHEENVLIGVVLILITVASVVGNSLVMIVYFT